LAAQQQVCTAPVSSAVLFFPGTMRKKLYSKGYSFSQSDNFFACCILQHPKEIKSVSYLRKFFTPLKSLSLNFFFRPESPTPSLVQWAGTPGCYEVPPFIFSTMLLLHQQ